MNISKTAGTSRDSVFSAENSKNVTHNFKPFLYFQQYATDKLNRTYDKGFS